VPYFLIVPAYLALLLILGIAAFVASRNPPWRPACGFIVGGMIGTLPGIIVANGIVTLVGILPAVLADRLSAGEGLTRFCGILTIIALILGPFAASLVGVLLGFAAGCLWVRLRRRAVSGTPRPAPHRGGATPE
jgi:hypothetical protein